MRASTVCLPRGGPALASDRYPAAYGHPTGATASVGANATARETTGRRIAAVPATAAGQNQDDVSLLQQLGATMVNFDLGFEIVPNTASGSDDVEDLNAYEVKDDSINWRGE